VNKRGVAMVILMAIIAVAGFYAVYIFQRSMSTMERTVYNLNEERALALSQAALRRSILTIRDEMNDFDLDFRSWFMQFRLPTLTLDAAASETFGLSGGAKIKLDLNATPLGSRLYAEHTYDAADLKLGSLIDSMGGRAEVEVKAKVDRAWGVFPDDPDYNIKGVTIGTEGVSENISDFLKEMLPEGSLRFNLNLPTPKITMKITIRYSGVPLFTLDLASVLGLNRLFDLNRLLRSVGLGNALSIDFGQLITNTVDSALNDVLPAAFGLPDIQTPRANLCVEKVGDVIFSVKIKYWPVEELPDEYIVRTIEARKEFKVADCQPIAPLYTLFVANSALANKSCNVNPGWAGNELIDFNRGGVLLLNSFDVTKLDQAIRQVNLPGKVRVNGTQKMRVNTAFWGKENGMKGCEFLSMVGHPARERTVIPDFRGCYIWEWAWRRWSWPYMGTANSWYTFPTLGTEYNRTHPFGTLFLNFPLGFNVEGNLVHRYRQWNFLYVEVFWLPTPFGAIPIPPVPFVIWTTDEKEKPLGYSVPNFENMAKPPTIFDPNERIHLPKNLYSLDQYLNKASYVYPTGADFLADFENRLDENGHFVIDGINFIADSVQLPDMRVKGKGMIVSAGNISLAGSIIQEDDDNTVLSLIARQGAIMHAYGDHTVEASCYTNEPLHSSGNLKIRGNLVVNKFSKDSMGGMTEVEYIASNTRMSLTSILPGYGKYDPLRYYVTMSKPYSSYKEMKQ